MRKANLQRTLRRILSVVGAIPLAAAAYGCFGDGSMSSAGSDDAGGGDSAVSEDADVMTLPCGSTACAQGQVCVLDHVVSGACYGPDDAGQCPNGTWQGPDGLVQLDGAGEGSCCWMGGTGYHCAARPSGCGSTLTCACASSICLASGTNGDLTPCLSASGDQVECEILSP